MQRILLIPAHNLIFVSPGTQVTISEENSLEYTNPEKENFMKKLLGFDGISAIWPTDYSIKIKVERPEDFKEVCFKVIEILF